MSPVKQISPFRIVIAAAIMLVTMGCLKYLSRDENIPSRKPFSTFPRQIGEWTGKEEHFDQKIYQKLGVDDSILCNYRTPDGSPVELYIGFYQRQRKGDIIHSPKNCMPGAGWNFARTGKTTIISPDLQGQNITVNNVLLERGNDRQVMFYWYQGRGRFMTSEYMQKIYLVTDSITRHRTDEAMVRLLAPVAVSEEETVNYLKEFTQQLIPVLQAYIPS
ncbi:MAG: exosortase C-terminal domain/associated protein EpsI [bacterium]